MSALYFGISSPNFSPTAQFPGMAKNALMYFSPANIPSRHTPYSTQNTGRDRKGSEIPFRTFRENHSDSAKTRSKGYMQALNMQILYGACDTRAFSELSRQLPGKLTMRADTNTHAARWSALFAGRKQNLGAQTIALP